MIPKIPIQVESSWQKELSFAFKHARALLDYLNIDPNLFPDADHARTLFPMLVPRPFVHKMEKGNPNDPLLLQVLPQFSEFSKQAGYSKDPLLEQSTHTHGMLHKYRSRVLLILKTACAVNCRYCFRRHFPYQDHQNSKQQWMSVFNSLQDLSEVNEVILSGGDPLMAKNDFLHWLSQQIENIPHIKRIRIHSRLPVVLPERIDEGLLHWLAQCQLQKVLVLHINHANEIDPELAKKLLQLKECGVTLLNQSVLLHKVNDSADSLCALSEKLFDCGVLPYYLFQLDKVEGAGHFEVTDTVAKQLVTEMIERLPGFLVPKLTREIGNQPGKTPIDLQIHP
jgi:EF-P beta-lysylation protein EpmB